MAELTIQVPDELAKRLQPLQNRLPELPLYFSGIPLLKSVIQASCCTNTSYKAMVF